MIDVVEHNRRAWDRESASGASEWSEPVSPALIAQARAGELPIVLTPSAVVPNAWFDTLRDARILGLASGGGQQVPMLAAAGGRVTSFDNSAEQLARDLEVARREGLTIKTELGDMADLSRFETDSFDLVFNPVSTVFVADIARVWREVHRVLRPGGRLLTGVMNPAIYLFDQEAIEQGAPALLTHKLPYSDVTHLTEEKLRARIAAGEALEYSHTLDTLIGDLLRAGFMLKDFYEDGWSDDATPLNPFFKVSFAMLAIAQ